MCVCVCICYLGGSLNVCVSISWLVEHTALDSTSLHVTAPARASPGATSLQRQTCLVEKTGSVSPHRAEGPWLRALDISSAGCTPPHHHHHHPPCLPPPPQGPSDSPKHTAESLP